MISLGANVKKYVAWADCKSAIGNGLNQQANKMLISLSLFEEKNFQILLAQ